MSGLVGVVLIVVGVLVQGHFANGHNDPNDLIGLVLVLAGLVLAVRQQRSWR